MTRPEAQRPESDAAADRAAVDDARDGAPIAGAIAGAVPDDVQQLMAALWGAGHAAYVVGGSLRDTALGRPAKDWDLATDALPDQTLAVFPDAAYENAFGTVAVRRRPRRVRDHDVPDRPRLRRLPAAPPRRVRGVARGRPRPPRLHRQRDGLGRVAGRVAAPGRSVRRARGRGLADAARGRRPGHAVRGGRAADAPGGAPRRDARLRDRARDARRDRARARRSPPTCPASGSRWSSIGSSPRSDPRSGCGSWPRPACSRPSCRSSRRSAACPRTRSRARTSGITPSRTVDAAVAHPVVRLAALLHDIGKPATAADGHFSATRPSAPSWPGRCWSGCTSHARRRERVVHLVRQHMFRYEPAWTDSAVRRFIGKVGSRTRSMTCSRCARRTTRAAAWRATPDELAELRARVEARAAGRAGARPVGARDRRLRPDRRARSRARTGAGADARGARRAGHRRPGAQRGADAAARSPGTSRRSTDDRAAARGRAGHERSGSSTRRSGCIARSRSRSAELDRGRRAGARRARAGRRRGRPTPSGRRALTIDPEQPPPPSGSSMRLTEVFEGRGEARARSRRRPPTPAVATRLARGRAPAAAPRPRASAAAPSTASWAGLPDRR